VHSRTIINTAAIRKIIIGGVNASPLLSYTIGHSYPIGKDDKGREKKIHISRIQFDQNQQILTGDMQFYIWGKTNNEGEEWIWKSPINQIVMLEFFEP